ncbi:MAG: hypothetical protein O2874_04530 [Verrucomicrobia bacterium]|nr:hypothetical protein [Verrucomicrobiota bacterium]
MKNLIPLALLSVLFVMASSAKSRIGQYVLGFGYSMAESGADDREGDFLRITAQAPNSSNSDLGVYLDYGTMEQNGSDASSWNLGADYLFNFNGVGGRSARFTPFLGAGVGYLDEETPIRLGEDGFTWSLLVGSEIQFSNSLSLNLGGRFFGLWSEFGENEFTADASINWWFNAVHGVSFEYQRAFEAELNYFTLKYLYSWR